MNRTPIASPLLLVGLDATETWHGSDAKSASRYENNHRRDARLPVGIRWNFLQPDFSGVSADSVLRVARYTALNLRGS